MVNTPLKAIRQCPPMAYLPSSGNKSGSFAAEFSILKKF
jgi:hypothetical protein